MKVLTLRSLRALALALPDQYPFPARSAIPESHLSMSDDEEHDGIDEGAGLREVIEEFVLYSLLPMGVRVVLTGDVGCFEETLVVRDGQNVTIDGGGRLLGGAGACCGNATADASLRHAA